MPRCEPKLFKDAKPPTENVLLVNSKFLFQPQLTQCTEVCIGRQVVVKMVSWGIRNEKREARENRQLRSTGGKNRYHTQDSVNKISNIRWLSGQRMQIVMCNSHHISRFMRRQPQIKMESGFIYSHTHTHHTRAHAHTHTHTHTHTPYTHLSLDLDLPILLRSDIQSSLVNHQDDTRTWEKRPR